MLSFGEFVQYSRKDFRNVWNFIFMVNRDIAEKHSQEFMYFLSSYINYYIISRIYI